MCRPAAIYVSSYYYMKVEANDLLLTVVAIYVSPYYYIYVCPHTAAIYVSSYYYMKVEADDLLLTVVAESTFIEWLQRLQASLNRTLIQP